MKGPCTVDVLADGQQIYVGPVADESYCRDDFERVCHALGTSVDYRDDTERTARLIRVGEIVSEKTYRNGTVLDSK